MTNRERVLVAINFKKSDYVPYCVPYTKQAADNMTAYTGDSSWTEKINQHITVVDLNRPFTNVKPDFDMDEFGVVWNKSGADKDIGVIDNIQISCAEEFESYAFPPVEDAYIRDRMDWLMQTKSDNFKVAQIGFSLFERAWTLAGMENLLCDMIAEPEFVHRLLNTICERNLKILDIALEYNIDCFHFGDDWGQQRGLIMGLPHWCEFIRPYVKKMYDKVHSKGKYVSQHSCGDLREVMDDLYDIGLNVYQTFQPEIYGLDYAKKLYGKITVWGGISTQKDLPAKTPKQIKKIVKDTISAFPHGGLVVSPTHSIEFDVPPENIIAMLEAFENQ